MALFMAFHNPDPKLRKIEMKNAEIRAAIFSRVHRSVWRFLVRSVTRIAHRSEKSPQSVNSESRHKLAVRWIVALLEERNIPYLVCGGLAAKGYDSERELNDIDLFVPGEHFLTVVGAAREHISKPPKHYQEEGWDLTYVQFSYEGVKVEVGNADGPKIYDVRGDTWVSLYVDFSRYMRVKLLGLELPLMLEEDLIRYKSVLSRPVDVADIRAMREEPKTKPESA
ncbi:hypothetical protein GCM10009113_09420 [Marinobacter szutsaonensis]